MEKKSTDGKTYLNLRYTSRSVLAAGLALSPAIKPVDALENDFKIYLLTFLCRVVKYIAEIICEAIASTILASLNETTFRLALMVNVYYESEKHTY